MVLVLDRCPVHEYTTNEFSVVHYVSRQTIRLKFFGQLLYSLQYLWLDCQGT